MAQASRKRIVTRSTQSVATETTEGKTKIPSVPSVVQNSVSSVLLLLLALASCKSAADAPAPVEVSMHIYPAKYSYRLGQEEFDPEHDLYVFIEYSDNRTPEPVTYYLPDSESGDLVQNPDLQLIYPAPFETPGYSLILVLYKNFIANYYVLVYDPTTGSDGSGGGGGGTTPGTGIDVPINW
jgi:hypothetical protein